MNSIKDFKVGVQVSNKAGDIFKITMQEEMIVVDVNTCEVPGTTANLKLGDTLSVD